MLRGVLVAVLATFLAGSVAPSFVQADSAQARVTTSKKRAKAKPKAEPKAKAKPKAKRSKATPKKSPKRAPDEEPTPRAPLP